ncbi:MAG: DUF2614 family zinc ribbon-containing protein [Pseudanabaenaceae cyanobacterium SKYGB_i_bin29]|nr:hydrogenase maturation nickel metallochaperone HypA [Pseudanabaenaceae cyanobacterium SKYG29]MDW8421608.1 DUF2614 family zinc ribbon-containing protein [Pseudanabaenaceae cyanobacterium SKYGB_i_bin29]
MSYYQLDGIRFWLGLLLFVTLMGTLGLGWLVQSLLFIFLLLVLAPILLLLGLQIWLRTRVVTASCPVCGHISTAMKDHSFICPACGEPLEVRQGKFTRIAPPGTIDVEVQTVD